MKSTKDQYIFFCNNVRTDGRPFCGGEKTEALHEYCRKKLKTWKANRLADDKRIIKANKTGCLGRCALGPNIVIFPDNTWHRCESEEDIDKLIEPILED